MNLAPAEIIALSKAVTAKETKEAVTELPAGEYDVDFIVQVQGSIKRGEDYEQRIVAKAEPWMLLAAALSHLNGVTVASLVKEALTADPALAKSLKKEAAEAVQEVKDPTTTQCNGKITTNVIVVD